MRGLNPCRKERCPTWSTGRAALGANLFFVSFSGGLVQLRRGSLELLWKPCWLYPRSGIITIEFTLPDLLTQFRQRSP